VDSFPATNKEPKEMSIVQLPTNAVQLPTNARQYCNAQYMKSSSVLPACTRMKITSSAHVTCLYCI